MVSKNMISKIIDEIFENEMDSYWLTFRFKQDGTYKNRYTALTNFIESMSLHWIEPTSFCAFRTNITKTEIITSLEDIIDEEIDVILLCDMNHKDYTLLGNAEKNSVYKLFPVREI